LFDHLLMLEERFRRTLLSTENGRMMYEKFMDFIINDKRNILSARVYFRERQYDFSDKIANAFDQRKVSMLYKLRINFVFAKWVMDRYAGPKKNVLTRTCNDIMKVRKLLCEKNLPLAINRAKCFWTSVPHTHLQYMDLVQGAAEGLVSAIDKFCPDSGRFCGVAIGRMTLNMSTDHSETHIKLPPKQKRILYRANKANKNNKMATMAEILAYVQESFKDVTIEELSEIMNAANGVISMDKPVGNDSDTDNTQVVADRLSSEDNPEENLIKADTRDKVCQGVNSLEVIEKKVVVMKHGNIRGA
ncbi:MAG: hypothetical protein ACREGB_04110, partial [Candidatus Saccharimonadales bacterium]